MSGVERLTPRAWTPADLHDEHIRRSIRRVGQDATIELARARYLSDDLDEVTFEAFVADVLRLTPED